ncbi:SIS domain-containing protein [[Clostridium] symbiosum]|uniref:D-sedoheptulose-7-phosphate isomerase n=1 Tax=Clostridium symbiosum TaxID=1512 RepID=UPI001D09785E|nr:SIS domain-containing protein [[Clostridium] symbiosum]MCB6611497.1 SIS domain-containing protein [[Clostridium] symbiosum]MCB6930902.1 SIS domain-containing protein [[Clostridium] symbiosum]
MDEYRYLTELTERYPVLKQVEGDIKALYEIVRESYENGGKLLIAGNGGSCADSEHIVGELMKGFVKKRSVPEEMAQRLKAVDPERGEKLAGSLQQGLAAIALTGHTALSTAFLNDVDGEVIYAQQVYGYGKPGDVLLGITTSGNSENIIYAAVAAKAKGMKVVGLTGRDGGKLKGICDAAVVVPETETFKIQELHLPVYHALCLMLEEHFFR